MSANLTFCITLSSLGLIVILIDSGLVNFISNKIFSKKPIIDIYKESESIAKRAFYPNVDLSLIKKYRKENKNFLVKHILFSLKLRKTAE